MAEESAARVADSVFCCEYRQKCGHDQTQAKNVLILGAALWGASF